MTAIEEALRELTFPDGSTGETGERRSQVTRLFAQAGRLITEKSQLLGAEALVAPEIDRQLEAVKKELLGLLPILSLEVFFWRDEKGRPKLAMISVGDPQMKFQAFWHEFNDRPEDHERDWHNFLERGGEIPTWETHWASVQPALPGPVRHYFRDIIDGLRDFARQYVTSWNRDAQIKTYLEHRYDFGHSIVARFGGLIPRPVRARLVTAQTLFGPTNVFLIFEAEGWSSFPVRVDPIAVAWDGAQLRALEVFDPTPLERFVADEYSV